MFIYGKDIPLDEVVNLETTDHDVPNSIEPGPYTFTYGKDIFPEEDTE